MTTTTSSSVPPLLPATNLEGLKLVRRGKVRDVYEVDAAHLLLVSSDRVSAFDYVLDPAIPYKGAVLNGISAWWFEKVGGKAAATHLVTVDIAGMPEAVKRHAATIAGRAALCRRAKIIPYECIVRGHLAGSAVKEYEKSGTVAGESAPAGLKPGDRFETPLFTPTTKAETGHDEPVTLGDMGSSIGAPLVNKLRDASIALFVEASRIARERGLILVDTKLEWGIDEAAELVLCDEIFTPDSSRYWLAEEWTPGAKSLPEPLDKQVVRNWLLQSSWSREGQTPPLPPDVVIETARRYLRLYTLLTGKTL